jgi:hypothetical protein
MRLPDELVEANRNSAASGTVMNKRFIEEQILEILRQAKVDGWPQG